MSNSDRFMRERQATAEARLRKETVRTDIAFHCIAIYLYAVNELLAVAALHIISLTLYLLPHSRTGGSGADARIHARWTTCCAEKQVRKHTQFLPLSLSLSLSLSLCLFVCLPRIVSFSRARFLNFPPLSLYSLARFLNSPLFSSIVQRRH